MNREIPKGWIEVPEIEFCEWLKIDSPNYRRSGWGNLVFYYIKHQGEYDGEFACHTRDHKCYVDPTHIATNTLIKEPLSNPFYIGDVEVGVTLPPGTYCFGGNAVKKVK